MLIMEIKILDKFYIKGTKFSIDENLFFDLTKVSFVSEEFLRDEPLNTNGSKVSFYFNMILDGIMFKVSDEKVLEFPYGINQQQVQEFYKKANVFRLRRAIIKYAFSKEINPNFTMDSNDFSL